MSSCVSLTRIVLAVEGKPGSHFVPVSESGPTMCAEVDSADATTRDMFPSLCVDTRIDSRERPKSERAVSL